MKNINIGKLFRLTITVLWVILFGRLLSRDYFIEKLDVSEEKVRLKNHCAYFIETIDSNESSGKKLGFISQELGREINTMGSKANHNEIQKLVVQMKDALEKIKDMLSAHATVIRDDQRKDIEAINGVKGDLVYLEAGDNIPADVRIVDSDRLKIQESSLTGEADSIEKTSDSIEEKVGLGDQINMGFASTSVTNGGIARIKPNIPIFKLFCSMIR